VGKTTIPLRGIGLAAWYLFLGLGIVAISFVRPVFNWDVLGYVGSARALETSDIQRIHEFAYASVRAAVPDTTFAIIAPDQQPAPAQAQPDHNPTVPEYRASMKSDPGAFAEQLPLYQVRFMYIGLVFGLFTLGVPIVLATYAISGVSVCIGLWLLGWMAKGRLQTSATLALSLLALVFGAITIGKLSTPDGLAFLGYMLCILLFINNRWESMPVAVLLIGLRMDLVLFGAPFLLFCIFTNRFRRLWSIAAFVALCGLYMWIKWHYGYPGWSTMFRFAIGEWVPHPLTSPASVTISQYVKALLIGIWSGANKPAFLVFVIIAAWGAGLVVKRVRRESSAGSFLRSPVVAVLGLSILYVVVHFLLFPELQERFFLGSYLTAAFALAMLLEGREEDAEAVLE
jgi:hypothetical protein